MSMVDDPQDVTVDSATSESVEATGSAIVERLDRLTVGEQATVYQDLPPKLFFHPLIAARYAKTRAAMGFLDRRRSPCR